MLHSIVPYLSEVIDGSLDYSALDGEVVEGTVYSWSSCYAVVLEGSDPLSAVVEDRRAVVPNWQLVISSIQKRVQL